MKKIILFIALLGIGSGAFAQLENPVTWTYGSKRLSATEAVVFIKATIDEGWHIYSQKKVVGPNPTTFTFPASKAYTLVGTTIEPKPITKYEKAFKTNVSYFENEVVFQQKVKVKAGTAAVVKGSFEYMTCNDTTCLPPDELNFSIAVPAKPAAK
ncbi:protein-disulfide reductase DsbD domain-containing protein [Hufsiella ginkgonis]|uniref:Sugar transporter n=1 Tax=Hufsiella ginkgonis TaxID=2695274 RepID=A0A7K1XV89_9SPHI|nr:protein-disulfide reductase DsbD domain-containing protein [Hufsiella ginkgonis]MXV14911.1 sugar transporter [Hufsiella ginkgonis]